LSVAVESAASALSERLDALAAALRAAGVPASRSAALLATAAEATMHAVTLEALREERLADPPAAQREPVAAPAAVPISLAA